MEKQTINEEYVKTLINEFGLTRHNAEYVSQIADNLCCKYKNIDYVKAITEAIQYDLRYRTSKVMATLQFYRHNGALFCNCRKHRFVLWRIWDDIKPKVMFIGLNPSTANEYTDDPTIRRVVKIANNWGYGGIFMLNLFTYITPYPGQLQIDDYSIFMADIFLKLYADRCEKIIFAWGNFNEAKERGNEVMKMFPGYMLIKNKDGSPRHPLYVPGNVVPVKCDIN